MIKQILFSLSLFILLSIAGFGVRAEEYLVASAVAFKDALQKVQAGDVIICEDGSYNDVKINIQPKQNLTGLIKN